MKPCLFIFAALLMLLPMAVSFAGDAPVATKGVLDLHDYNFRSDGIINLDGEWDFYWDRFTDPLDSLGSSEKIIKVPTPWRELQEVYPEVEATGFASYRLKIMLPDDARRFAIRCTEVFSASAYYVNGKSIGFNGFPGSNRYQEVFGHAPSLFVFDCADSVMNLVIHVSNFEHRSGGIRGVIQLGTPMQLMSKRADKAKLDSFLLGAFLIIGVYFMGIFIMQSEPYKLYFALLCLVMAFRIDFLSESGLIPYTFGNGITRLRIEYLSFNILVPLFVMMVKHLFPYDFNKTLFRIIMWVSVLQVVLVILSPLSIFTGTLRVYIGFVIFTSLVLIYVTVIAWIRGRAFARGLAIGIGIVVLGAVNDMLYVADVLETGYISQITMFIYLLIYALIFSQKSNNILKRTDQLSAEIVSMNKNLEKIVEKRTRELNQKSVQLEAQQQELMESNMELQKVINVRNKFFTIIGHDIRGPVASTKQIVDLLLSGEISREDEENMLRLLASSSNATITLLENLLVWGRSQTGNLSVNRVEINLDSIIEETVELFSLAMKEKDIAIEIDLDKRLVVFADTDHIKLVLRNLLGNAIKFTNAGGRVELSAGLSEDHNEVIFQVSDTGIGIPSVIMDKLFSEDAYYTSYGTGREKGSGIGLKLCREVLKQNNGWINVESKSGRGSTFTFGLPAHLKTTSPRK